MTEQLRTVMKFIDSVIKRIKNHLKTNKTSAY